MMPKPANEVFRDFVRYTDDGLPNAPVGHPLPVGDPRSGVHNPPKAAIRDWANGFKDWVTDAVAGVEDATALAADRTYYVSTTGSDSNNGLSSGTPFATLQAAANAARNLRLNGKTVVVNIANGTYTAGVNVGGAVFGAPNPSNLQFIGNEANPAAVVIHVTGGNCFNATNGASFRVSGVTVRTTTSGTGLNATRGGHIEHGNVVFGPCANFHKQATDGGRVVSTDAYSITGGATAHMHSTTGGYILVGSATITITGTPAFSQYFAGVSGAAVQVQAGVTWSGSVTGKKFAVHNSGMIRTFDQGLPGTIDGDAYGGGTMDDIHTLEVFRAKGSPLLVVNETDASKQEVARFRGQRATPANGDAFYNHFQARDDAGQDVNVARVTWTLTNVANGAETGHLAFGAIANGSMVNALSVTGTAVQSLLPHKLPVYTVAGAPSAGAAGAGSLIHVSNEIDGAVVAFSDGTVWRRVTDRAVIS